MLGIDLSTLSRPELQRLLKVALARGDAALAERLEWELGSRGKGGGLGVRPMAVPAPPQGDPGEETPRKDPAETAAVDVIEPDEEPIVLAPIVPEPAAPKRASARGGLMLVGLGLGVVAGCLISGGVFWGLGRMDRSPMAGSALAPTLRAMTVRPLEVTPAPQPEPTAPAPAPVLAPVVPAAKPPVEVATTVAPPNEVTPRQEPTPRPPPPTVRLAEAEVTPHTAVQSGACARSTPADRLVCKDLSLQLFDLQLQEAYRRALNARVDPVIVGEDQAAWRRARDEVSDPQRLARLYNQRIHELDAATASARENRPPG